MPRSTNLNAWNRLERKASTNERQSNKENMFEAKLMQTIWMAYACGTKPIFRFRIVWTSIRSQTKFSNPRQIYLVFGSSRFVLLWDGRWGWSHAMGVGEHCVTSTPVRVRLLIFSSFAVFAHSWLKDTWESFETGELFCKITLCLISFSSLGN